MKPLTYISFISLLVLKIVFISLFIFQTESSNLLFNTKAIASENITDAPVATKPLPEIEDENNKDNMAFLLKQKAELKSQQEELAAIRDDISNKIEKLTRLREEIKLDLAKIETIQNKKTKHLIKAYSAMKPQSAAELVEKLDTDFAVELLSQMKGEAVGTILSNLDKDKAAKITKGLVGK
ncbi:MAG: hypothetical protein KKC46_03345 [Proteobacteria bacterium]|nr:hypothetical protein [Pseudomonadota bacterium]